MQIRLCFLSVFFLTISLSNISNAQDQTGKIACYFVLNEQTRSLYLTLAGEAGRQQPNWIAQTTILRSGPANNVRGTWIGVADINESTRLAEITLSKFHLNGRPAAGISIAAAPVMRTSIVAMRESGFGGRTGIIPDPVWGVLKVDGSVVMTGKMTPRDYSAGKFLEMSAGYLARQNETTPFGVDAELTRILNKLSSVDWTVTLEIYADLSVDDNLFKNGPRPGQQPLADFGFSPDDFQSEQTWARQTIVKANTEFARGCPNNLVTPGRPAGRP